MTDRVNLVRQGFEAWNAEDPWSRWRNAVVQLKFAQVFSFGEDDKCIRVQEFYDRGAALRAAGLE